MPAPTKPGTLRPTRKLAKGEVVVECGEQPLSEDGATYVWGDQFITTQERAEKGLGAPLVTIVDAPAAKADAKADAK